MHDIERLTLALVLGLRRCEPGDAQIDQQLDAKAVRQHQRFGHAFQRWRAEEARGGGHCARAAYRPIGLPGSV